MSEPVQSDRLEELESRLAFQDDLIENLNEVIARQDRELLDIKARVVQMESKLNDLADSFSSPAGGGGHELPPHY